MGLWCSQSKGSPLMRKLSLLPGVAALALLAAPMVAPAHAGDADAGSLKVTKGGYNVSRTPGAFSQGAQGVTTVGGTALLGSKAKTFGGYNRNVARGDFS